MALAAQSFCTHQAAEGSAVVGIDTAECRPELHRNLLVQRRVACGVDHPANNSGARVQFVTTACDSPQHIIIF